MKLILIVGLVAGLAHNTLAKLPEADASKLADAIFKIENSKKYPYGIKSIPLKGDTQEEKTAYARKACLQTIQNNHDRWIKAGKPGFYVDFLANRYCPESADKQGNLNWKKNVRKFWGEQ